MPVGDVVATEAAIEVLSRTRSWAMLAASVFFIGGALGVLLGIWVVIVFFINRGTAQFASVLNFLVGLGGGLFGSLSLVAGVLLVSFVRAVGRTNSLRRPEDLERTMIALRRMMRWTALCLLAVLAYPFVVLATAIAVGALP